MMLYYGKGIRTDTISGNDKIIIPKGIPMIRFRFANTLKEKHLEDISRLVDACIAYEGLTLSMPDLSDEGVQVYSFYPTKKEENLLGVLVAYPFEEYTEITAFTHPDCRCQGIFTSLFQRYLEKNGDGPVCFYPDGCSYDALATLEVLECEYNGTEQLMHCDLNRRTKLSYPASLSLEESDDLSLLSKIHSDAFGQTQTDSRLYLENALADGAVCWLIKDQETPVGLCLGTGSEDTVYLFGLCIAPAHQRKGLGTAALGLLLDCLAESYQSVSIQVTEENTAASRLYCKAGFTSVQELQEFWY